MNKKIVIVVVAVGLAAGFFAGGAYVGPSVFSNQGAAIGAPDGARGPMGQLTEEERSQLQGMSDAERQAFLQERLGDNAPVGAAVRMGGPGGQRVIDGEIAEVGTEQITIKTSAGGSQAVYIDDSTIVAIAEGSRVAEPVAGAKISAVVTPETDNVLAASILVLQ